MNLLHGKLIDLSERLKDLTNEISVFVTEENPSNGDEHKVALEWVEEHWVSYGEIDAQVKETLRKALQAPQPEELTVDKLGNWFEIMMAERSEQIIKIPRTEQKHPADFYAEWIANNFHHGLKVVKEKTNG